jgi:hypothetical protein
MSSRKNDPPERPTLLPPCNDQQALSEIIQDGPPITGSPGSGKTGASGKQLLGALMRFGLDGRPLPHRRVRKTL